ncbi:MAG: hypothetical protein MUE72_01965 [Chitinophagaceae bacterium]|nr:hypothetical protein [Chitinophagaceae bacterium]
MKLYNKLKVFFTIFFLAITFWGSAQLPANMSRVKSADISDAQLLDFVQKAQAAGQSETQIVQEFTRRGMPIGEINAIKARIQTIPNASSTVNTGVQKQGPARVETNQKTNNPTEYLNYQNTIFGTELFSNPSLSFEPDLRIPLRNQFISTRTKSK